ncbi:glycosyltransferase family 2 protein [Plebeiibacterium marinum]|uniref:Glycosyltransferase n=1 Tax=Plebeiibacterium marinum TaxID=2992111 RepID=A0AAE3MDJ0_9BACT|nr:glycosyltransferase family 2 protein [Plebeiobacterium marinum]MCW3805813.1 glycosyltransferase [Plebeiobacterium marinum]
MAPLVTVVTVVFNDKLNIENTIKSVIQQSYKTVQYIVIDGNSSDGTLDIINRYREHIDVLISEPDKGVYDAMNKGIGKAAGDWIIFMNSGDLFYNESVLEDIFSFDISADVIYGNIVYAHDNEKVVTPRKLDTFWKGLPFNHQASLVRTELYKKYKYDLRYSISSVHDFFFKLFNEGYRFKYTDRTIAIYDLTGMSATSYKWLVDNWNINMKHSKTKMHLVIGALMLHFLSKIKRSILRKNK